jgi:amino acid adenylation domain-containing protein
VNEVQNLSDLLSAAAQSVPDNVALWWNGTSVLYRELDATVQRLCRRLESAGVAAGNLVLTLSPKSPAAVAANQAVLRQDAVYVPLDVRAPSARLAAIAQACGARHVILHASARRHQDALRAAGVSSFIDLEDDLSASDVESRRPRHGRTELAFVLHTSGSTGKPKGVMISHGNALSFVEWAVSHFGLSSRDRLLCHAPLTFDLPVFDLYAAFMLGASVALVPDAAALFPAETVRIIREARVTSLFMVPSAMIAMIARGGWLDAPPGELRTIMYSGEPFPPRQLSRVLEWGGKGVRVANIYGPIETNGCTFFDVESVAPEATAVPIGYPIAETEVRLSADDGDGSRGEIAVAGPTVAMGYWGSEQLTAERWFEHEGRRWYRTGDIGRRDERGCLWYEGRRDFMIKSRGFRIELGEIELAISHCAGVEEVVAVAVPHPEFSHLIHAWVTPEAPIESEIKRSLMESLPNYMVPQRIFTVASLPRTQSGKLDRGALLRMSLETTASSTRVALAAGATRASSTWLTSLTRVVQSPGPGLAESRSSSLPCRTNSRLTRCTSRLKCVLRSMIWLKTAVSSATTPSPVSGSRRKSPSRAAVIAASSGRSSDARI